ncbi:GNAT family N-acetyltransferase [Virgibacillus proomii]|uniref:GNAT family N-acetyltransferase n=1 Tax=Virgibacillus proomii TaxID=84407 RepID=UPI000986C426|nr:GNAT family N-acetyltransferase [Virgibacillus proomii]
MEIKKGQKNFYVGDKKNPIAEITYYLSDDGNIVIDHTEVADELRGKGIAGKLVAAVVEQAKAEGKKIKPICSYAKNKMEKTPEYQDVLV